MVGWHYQLNGHEFEQTLGDSEGQGRLVCCIPLGHKESDTTEQLSWWFWSFGMYPPLITGRSTVRLLIHSVYLKITARLLANAGWHQGRDVLVCTLTSHNSVLLDYFPVVVQPLSRVQFFATPWIAGPQAPLSFTVSQSLLKFKTMESVMPSNHLILFCLFLLLPLIFPRFTFL